MLPRRTANVPSVPPLRHKGPGCSVGTTGNSGGDDAAGGWLLKWFPGGGCGSPVSICPAHMFSNLPPNWELYLCPGQVTVYCRRKEAGSVLHFKVLLPSLQAGIPGQPAALAWWKIRATVLPLRDKFLPDSGASKEIFLFQRTCDAFSPLKINESYRTWLSRFCLGCWEARI